jgi:hypothetical protein
MKLRPDCEPLALWLADAVLAHRLRWPTPVPLIAKEIRRADLRAAPRHLEGDGAWLMALSLAYARAAASASDLYAELARRATPSSPLRQNCAPEMRIAPSRSC